MGHAIRMSRSWSGVYRTPLTLNTERLREAGAFAVKVVLVLAFLYTASIAWELIQELRNVKLYQLRDVLRIASVGDLILLWAAYALSREFIRALGRRRNPPEYRDPYRDR